MTEKEKYRGELERIRQQWDVPEVPHHRSGTQLLKAVCESADTGAAMPDRIQIAQNDYIISMLEHLVGESKKG